MSERNLFEEESFDAFSIVSIFIYFFNLREILEA